MKRKLSLKIEDLELAIELVAAGERNSFELEAPNSAYLNLVTGETLFPEDEEEDEALFEDENVLPIEADLKPDDYRTMAAFVDSLDPGPVREELAEAIRGKGAFRRFRGIVLGGGDIELRHAWYEFEKRAQRQTIVDWLESNSIEPEWDRDPFEESALPNKRPELIAAVLEFVAKASSIEGVRRIALLGSLATEKAQPKDVDVVVEVDEDLPLAGLAKAGRQLRGKTMQSGESRGADVFLCDAAGIYLGRACTFKQCGPAYRSSCEAQHCGRREFLCDDLRNVRLDSELVRNPPIDLWPSIEIRCDVPDDVNSGLIEPLRQRK